MLALMQHCRGMRHFPPRTKKSKILSLCSRGSFSVVRQATREKWVQMLSRTHLLPFSRGWGLRASIKGSVEKVAFEEGFKGTQRSSTTRVSWEAPGQRRWQRSVARCTSLALFHCPFWCASLRPDLMQILYSCSHATPARCNEDFTKCESCPPYGGFQPQKEETGMEVW